MLCVCHTRITAAAQQSGLSKFARSWGDAVVKSLHHRHALLLAGQSPTAWNQMSRKPSAANISWASRAIPSNCSPHSPVPMLRSSAPAPCCLRFSSVRDQTATGGTIFAGATAPTSTTLTRVGYLTTPLAMWMCGFFGEDPNPSARAKYGTQACYGPGETYEWSTGSAQSIIFRHSSRHLLGTRHLRKYVVVMDAVDHLDREPAPVDLGPRTPASVRITSSGCHRRQPRRLDYAWQDGSTSPTFEVTQNGDYAVER